MDWWCGFGYLQIRRKFKFQQDLFGVFSVRDFLPPLVGIVELPYGRAALMTAPRTHPQNLFAPPPPPLPSPAPLIFLTWRLVRDDERKWTDENIDSVAAKHFPNVDGLAALQRPILYSCWLTKDYLPVDREELREYVKARLKVGNVVFEVSGFFRDLEVEGGGGGVASV